jgi:kinetochor protein Mis14/NSL1
MALATANIFESHGQLHGDRATENAHRKIELQAPADLTYLIANVTKAAREKIDKHFPPDATQGDDDAMRRRVEQLVDEYIRSTFHAAKDNMTINGMDSKEMDAELAKAQDGEGAFLNGTVVYYDERRLTSIPA